MDAVHDHANACGRVHGRLDREQSGRIREVHDRTGGDRSLAGGFLPQLHVVLLEGVGFGGLNLVDLPALAARLGRPCVAVMRRPPDLAAMEAAIRRLPRPERRLALLARAGPIHRRGPFTFQVHGAEPDATAAALARLTDRGNVPEPLRLAHLIGSAIRTGESGRRA
jgi:uncharacterized protein